MLREKPLQNIKMNKRKFMIQFFLCLITISYNLLAQTKAFIPDVNFRNYLRITYPNVIDITSDSLIIDSAAELTGVINCRSQDISDLTGIEYFKNIEQIWCSDNNLPVLPELSTNLKLHKLECRNNQLTMLPDLSNNIALSALWCEDNQLTSLPDLTSNTALTQLWCSRNSLTGSLNLSSNTNLLSLRCTDNQLSNLNLSNCSVLQELILSRMPSLFEVCVWEIPFPPAGLTIYTDYSSNIYFTTDCMTEILNISHSANFVEIYPNPNNGIFNITLNNTKHEIIELKLINILGQLIFNETINQKETNYTRELEVLIYSPGIYFLQIRNENVFLTKRVIIE
jgi:hypothetical protein